MDGYGPLPVPVGYDGLVPVPNMPDDVALAGMLGKPLLAGLVALIGMLGMPEDAVPSGTDDDLDLVALNDVAEKPDEAG